MASFLSAIWDTITSLVEFVKSIISGFITLFKLLPSVVSTAMQSIGYLPSIITVFATLTITICVIFLILGRNTGSGGD